MKTVRIAAGAGYAGDRIEPALDIIRRGNADYILFECLAERTIALAQKEKQGNECGGYNPLLEYRMERILPLLGRHPVKIITNMGAANPLAAAQKIHAMAVRHGLRHLRIAAVLGDDVLGYVSAHMQLPVLETGKALEGLAGKILSANAYTGGAGITQALAGGADVVVTGRVADPALATGPLVYELGGSYEDYDFLGKSIVAGHLLECGGQVTGGYFADPGKKDVPELWNLGFPICTFGEDGSIELEKLPGTGGLLNAQTVKEQLLYEVQNPAAYLTPDVVADFSRLQVQQLAGGRVRVTGGTGHPRTGTLKVSVGYADGWIGTGEISYGGQNCLARAQLAAEVIGRRIELLPFAPQEYRCDILGVNSLYKNGLPTAAEPAEVRLRAAMRTDTEAQAGELPREVEALYTNGPAGGGGARGSVTGVVSVASVLIPEDAVQTRLEWFGGRGRGCASGPGQADGDSAQAAQAQQCGAAKGEAKA